MGFVRVFVVLQRCTEKSKVHEELGAAAWDPFSQFVGGLFANIRLFLEVNTAEWVIFKFGWCAFNLVGEDIQLVFTRRAKLQSPNLRFDLAGLHGWVKHWVGAAYESPVAYKSNWITVDCVNIHVAVVQAVPKLEWELHGDETIMICKSEGAQEGGVFESLLCPTGEHVTGRQDCCWGDDGFDHVGTVKAWLIIGCAVGEGQGEEAFLCDTVIVGCRGTF